MFPNIRLMIVAMLASVVGICCGMALFAAFRVNHEPLTRMSGGGSPLQVAFGTTTSSMPARATDAPSASFGVRFPVNAPVLADNPASAVPLASTAGLRAATIVPAVEPAAPLTPSPGLANGDGPTDAVTAKPVVEALVPAAPTSEADQIAKTQTIAQPEPNDPGNIALGMAAAASAPAATSAPALSIAVSPPATEPALPIAVAPAAAANNVVPAKHTVPRRTVAHRARPQTTAAYRVVHLHHFRKAPAATVVPRLQQDFTLVPNYNSMPPAASEIAPAAGLAPPQPVQRRVVKRRRASKPTVTRAPAAPETTGSVTLQ